MAEKKLGIVMHGDTGRMGANQHLARSIVPLRDQGGVRLKDGTRVIPDPILVGRNAEKIERLARQHGIARWTTDLDAALANKDDTVFFDAASTQMRPALVKKAIAAASHLLRETRGRRLERLSICGVPPSGRREERVVQDKLWLPDCSS